MPKANKERLTLFPEVKTKEKDDEVGTRQSVNFTQGTRQKSDVS